MKVEVIPFLSLNGDAAAAITFYEKYLGAKVLFKKNYKEMKEMNPHFSYEEGQDDYITHSVLEIGANKLMIAEEEMDTSRPWQLGNSSSLCIQSKDKNVIQNLYESLVQHEKVTVLMPFKENVFSPGYAIIRDPYGIVIQLCVTVHDF
ncbi:VOC family protein [Siminovitchia terrae]|uniref:VOC family protein n=1 Tax=Siminovitchia terrae TaxID=1914933 RepID=A0A429X6C0_SIMTE|nr:VOC family protein [Siminovitchia terrae]RST58977.1 VOC family protein [Siminovitchia terrae]GIN89070.1 VOC family protein [Siminovitchia terrae]GIN95139.1 VOC family protein [Siminovitchia terrae]